MVNAIHTQIARSFALPKDIVLDPSLRAAASKIAGDHLVRIKTQLPAWIQEERKEQQREGGRARPDEVFYAVHARLLNEMAYWHLEPGDADYEQATLAVLKGSPQVCLTGDSSNFVDFSSRILRIQAMPAAQQQTALATEARLLDHWGKPRQEAQPWPSPLPQEAAMDAAARLHAGKERPAVAMAPAVAWQALSERNSFGKMPREIKCAFQRWWLEESLAKGQSAAAVLNAFRYGTLITASTRYANAFASDDDTPDGAAPAGKPAYPRLATRFGVTGKTRIERAFDTAGKPIQARVIKREIVVPGIRGLRPIAFEDAFDAVAIQGALVPPVAGAEGPALGKRYELVWNIAPPERASADPAPKEKK